jgi:muramidase (phage lysozyme)
MARLSTGQSYGDTNRSTAAQLLGGIPMDATSGAIAQSAINEPALRPQAAPVSTFQQVGAPTLGGPVKFFAPPDLPTPSQDLARLASVLGTFSPILNNLGESYIQRKKDEDARAQMAGQGVAQQLQLTAPGQDFITARDNLWRQAQAGDAGAATAYQQMQALSPMQQAYAQRYAGQAVLREDLATAVDRFNGITEIGGVPREQIAPGDPRLSATKATLYRIPSNDPAGFMEMTPLIAAKNGEIDRAHFATHLAWKERTSQAATQADLASHFMGKDINADSIVASQTNALTDARMRLGADQYQKFVTSYSDSLAAAVLAGSMGKDGKPDLARYYALSSVATDVFNRVGAGPNGERLIDSLGAKGGVAGQLAFTQKLMSQVKSFTNDVDAFSGMVGENQGQAIVDQLKLQDPAKSPAQRDADLIQAGLVLNQIKDPATRKAAEAVVRGAHSSANALFTAPIQAEAERNNQFSYDKDPAVEIRRAEEMKRTGQMSPAAADRLIANYRQVQGSEMRPWVNASKEAVDRVLKQELAAFKLPTSEGGSLVTQAENQFLITRRAQLTSDVETMRRKAVADGSGVAGFQTQLGTWSKQLEGQAPKPANPVMTPLFASPEAWKDKLGFFGGMGPGNAASNYQLRQRVDNGLVMPEPQFRKNFEAWVERGEMSDSIKLMIKRSGYGAKPSEFWRKQWQRNYPGVQMPAQYEQAIPERDQMKVSYQAGPASPTTQVAMAQSNFFRNLATGAVNALTMTAPAAAGEMPMGTMGQIRLGTPVVGTPKLNANAKAWLAAISAGGFEGADYNTYYGGGAFDNTKGHPMRVVRPAGGIPSSAAGRYQFMPDTWTGLHGGKNPPMTPANQDAGAYQLALNRGVDLNTAPVTIENVRKLAPVWAALPINATDGAGYYKGQGGAGFARFRQTWETERRRYSAGA